MNHAEKMGVVTSHSDYATRYGPHSNRKQPITKIVGRITHLNHQKPYISIMPIQAKIVKIGPAANAVSAPIPSDFLAAEKP